MRFNLRSCSIPSLALALAGTVAAQDFTSGNVVVYRVGDGVTALSGASAPVFLDEYDPAGTLVQSVAMPTAVSGSHRRLTASGSATSEGLLTRSADGLKLILTGYDAATATASIAGTAAGTVNRVIGLVSIAAGIDTTTALTDVADANNVRSAASVDGSAFWITGGAGGIRHATFGSTATSTQLSTTSTNLRQAAVVGGQLYITTGSGSLRLATVGSGLPTTAGQTITNLSGFPTTGSPYGFFLCDLNAGVAGDDTVYVADDSLGVQKFSLVGGTWTLNGTIGVNADDTRGLAGKVNGSAVELFIVGTANRLFKLSDTAGYNSAPSTTTLPAALVTAGTNKVFRGVALTPAVSTATVFSTTAVNASEGGATGAYTIRTTTVPDATIQVTITPDSQVDVGAGGGVARVISLSGASAVTGTSITVTAVDDVAFEGAHAGTITHAITSPATGYPTGALSTVTVSITDNESANTAPTISSIAALAGTISDAANPTAAFTISDAETPVGSLILTVTASTNTAVAAIGACTVANLGGGAATLAVAPTGVGYTTLTIQVSDGTLTSTATCTYAASAASAVANTRALYGINDGSAAVAIDATAMLGADDESNVLRIYGRTGGYAVSSLDLSPTANALPLQLTDTSGGVPREVDFEAATKVGSRVYLLGSHSNSSSGNNRPNRSRLVAIDLTGSGLSTVMTYAGRYDFLKADLLAWDSGNGHGLGANHYGLTASAMAGIAPEDDSLGGFNIEGVVMAANGTTAYIALRAPISPASARTKALIVPVTNFTSLLGAASGSATFGAPIELDLGGRGIRDLQKNAGNQYLILAGPANGSASSLGFRLYSWDGLATSAPRILTADLSGLNPEAIVEVPPTLAPNSQVQLLSDDGDTVWYGDGIISKDLTQTNFKKFRSNLVAVGFATTTIAAVQGAGHLSPFNNLGVQVSGIVTATKNNGYYLQSETPDADLATSEGIFVFTSSAPGVVVAERVTVTGTVAEFYGTSLVGLSMTELVSPTSIVTASAQPLPAAIIIGSGGRAVPTSIIDDDATGSVESSGTFDPTTDGIDFLESLEGMRVAFANPVATGPTNNFNETPVLVDNGAGASLRTARGGIIVRAGDFNPERLVLDDGVTTGAPKLNVGDSFAGTIYAVVDYNFDEYKFNVLGSWPAKIDGGIAQETTALVGSASDLIIATYNVENLDPGDTTFAAHAAVIVNRLKSPDILALEEIQDNNGTTNDGVVDASTTFNTLITAIVNAGGPAYHYRSINPVDQQDGGAPGGNIRVGFLFNPARVAFVDRAGGTATNSVAVNAGPTLNYSPGRIDPTNTAFTTSRKPLVGEFSFQGKTFFVVACHWNSKGGDHPLRGKFQPPVLSSEIQRLQQATAVNAFINQLRAVDANARYIVLGDLNDFGFSPPLNTLTASGTVLHNLADTLTEAERYDYVFQGNSQALDHILVSPKFMQAAVALDIVRVNAEFSTQLSDHDPIVAKLGFKDVPEFVTRFYQECLLRNPDAPGLAGWVNDLKSHGSSGTAVALGFLYSQEFLNRNTTDSQFIDTLYRAFFGREPDAAGKAGWLAAMAAGMLRQDVIDGFLGAAEFANMCQDYQITASSSVEARKAKVRAFVRGFYLNGLGREPDAAGIAGWTTSLIDGNDSGGNLARGVIRGQEFLNRNLSNGAFVDALYTSLLQRTADSDGRFWWWAHLQGGMPRNQVLELFISSQEFINICTSFGVIAGFPAG